MIMSSCAGKENGDIDDDNINNYLKRMITDFQILMGRKSITKDNITNIKVNNVQVTNLEYLMAPQPLVLQKWTHLFGHLCMEA